MAQNTLIQKFEHLLLHTFASLTVIGETSVDYDENACFQTLHLRGHAHDEHELWMESMLEVANHVSAQDCFLFCTLAERSASFQETFQRWLGQLGLNVRAIYHAKHGRRICNVSFRISEVTKLLNTG